MPLWYLSPLFLYRRDKRYQLDIQNLKLKKKNTDKAMPKKIKSYEKMAKHYIEASSTKTEFDFKCSGQYTDPIQHIGQHI